MCEESLGADPRGLFGGQRLLLERTGDLALGSGITIWTVGSPRLSEAAPCGERGPARPPRWLSGEVARLKTRRFVGEIGSGRTPLLCLRSSLRADGPAVELDDALSSVATSRAGGSVSSRAR